VTVAKRALLSVTDKTGVVDFARRLAAAGLEIVSTGGTARVLAEAGVPVREVADVTGFPEILDGRVKTLHPKIHGGVLARADDDAHGAALEAHGIVPFAVVAVNLYAFERAASDPAAGLDEVVEQIDIGGPTLLRAAAKNHASVIPVVEPRDYDRVAEAIEGGGLDPAERQRLALKVFRHTAAYDRAISAYLERVIEGEAERFPDQLDLRFVKALDLRYGENPHQAAAFYRDPSSAPGSLGEARLLQGKPLSYNNLLDAEAAWSLISDLGDDAAAYIKHNNPCGAARHAELAEALRRARAVDPTSAFGAVVAVARPVDAAAAEVLAETFVEVVLAPAFDEAARERLGRKKNLRLLELGRRFTRPAGELELRRVGGGLLVQAPDAVGDPAAELAAARLVTRRAPTDEEREALAFAWAIAKHVRSNAIVYAHADRAVAIGAGQMSRVDSVMICQRKGGEALKGSVVASDAFFPFRDGVDEIARSGATAIVQPGGSLRDEEVIAAADAHGLAMLFPGVRHFRH
jgi:phosphoribosylaminoimidazolecarboxamide formyltransferase/IMP cyclohydrolase